MTRFIHLLFIVLVLATLLSSTEARRVKRGTDVTEEIKIDLVVEEDIAETDAVAHGRGEPVEAKEGRFDPDP